MSLESRNRQSRPRQLPSHWFFALSQRQLHNQSGQVAVVILLIIVVLLTIGLSLATRTTQELFLSQQTSETARVFNAAETGIEQALTYEFGSEVQTGEISDIDDVSVSYKISPSAVLETTLAPGNSIMVEINGETNMTVEWVKSTSPAPACASRASLIASVYYQVGSNPMGVRHYAFGPNRTAGGCENGDNFVRGQTLAGPDYLHRYVLNFGSNARFARIRAVYNSTNLKVGGLANTQYQSIRSEASNDLGDEFRSIEVGSTLLNAPSFMDYALYSGREIRKVTP
jgi:Tfp pilus assembly protein PilX